VPDSDPQAGVDAVAAKTAALSSAQGTPDSRRRRPLLGHQVERSYAVRLDVRTWTVMDGQAIQQEVNDSAYDRYLPEI
jgi:hypothetical protein